MPSLTGPLLRYTDAIRRSGLSIYDPIEVGDPKLWIPSPELEAILDTRLIDLNLAGLPLRTRSKVVKRAVCEALGYPVPSSFRRTRPRFPGQYFDTYAQKSNNLQIWNEELSPIRRYVILRVSEKDVITRVRVVTGDTLSLLDTTGTLTQKYQARFTIGSEVAELVTPQDTANLWAAGLSPASLRPLPGLPTDQPETSTLLPIKTLFERLRQLIGQQFLDIGIDQERNRGAGLHRLACTALGFVSYRDDGQFPDVRNQLLEVKLQTSPTIDLGLVRPDSEDAIDIPRLTGRQVRHCDVRYAVFGGTTDGVRVTLSHVILTTGEGFFGRFPQFGGRVLNRKLQVPLPATFFSR
jgi:hypothetical protein